MTRPIYLLVQGMHLRADSIAYDVAFQQRLLQSWALPVEVFAETFDATHYPGVDARPFRELERTLAERPGLVVYHWVDGWRDADDLLLRRPAPVVLRWHNNTPPWFFASYSPIPAFKTVRGYRELLRMLDARPEARVWANSEFSRRQLGLLGIAEDRVDVLQPASTYLEREGPTSRARPLRDARAPLRLLFVGRVVPHKGHAHLLAAARAAAEMGDRPVCVSFPGRPDSDMPRYVPELRALAARLDVPLELPGELSPEDLERAYADADVFVGLSEHEGFGLPVLEAMTRGLPVVGYRAGAVAEILADHPLATDTLDPADVGHRILAAADETARAEIVDWQARSILPRFSRDTIARQLAERLMASGYDIGASPPSSTPPSAPPPPSACRALERARQRPAPGPVVPRDLPRDQNPHFVTRYDLESYDALLRAGPTGDLHGRALALEFSSHRGRLGAVTSLVKKAVLRLHDGLLRTLELSHNDLSSQLHSMSERIDRLSAEIARLRAERKRTDRPDP